MPFLEIPILESAVELFDRIPVLPPRNVPNSSERIYDTIGPLESPTPKRFDIEDQVSVKNFSSSRNSESCCKRCSFQLAILNGFLLIFMFSSFLFLHSYFKEKRCHEGFLEFKKSGFCYKVITIESNFPQALQYCRNLNSNLVSIHSERENNFVADLSRNSGTVFEDRNRTNEEVWIGLVYANGQWEWSDGSRLHYSNWATQEPNDLGAETRGTLMTSRIMGYNPNGTLWNNIEGGSYQRAFVCKKWAS